MKKSELVKIVKEAIVAKKLIKEGEEKSIDQLMSDLGDAILADNNEAVKAAFKNLKTGLIGRIKNKAQDLRGYLDKKYTDESINEADYTPERRVYDIVENLVERALSAIEKYKGSAQSDQSGDMGLFHDVEVALEEVLDFLIYTQKPDVDESVKSKVKKN